jgi:hypothetical protein
MITQVKESKQTKTKTAQITQATQDTPLTHLDIIDEILCDHPEAYGTQLLIQEILNGYARIEMLWGEVQDE